MIRYKRMYHEATDDVLAIEEPLQIRLAGEDVAVTMRTPGHDDELAAGFLFSEGIIGRKEDIEAIAYCLSDTPGEGTTSNIINVLPSGRELLEPGRWGRNFIASSSCGLCGKTSIEQVMGTLSRLNNEGSGVGDRGLDVRPDPQSPIPNPQQSASWPLSVATLYTLPGKLRAQQDTFSQTGGIHAAALFTSDGDLLVMREDVGRHNAVDKIIGHALLNGWLPVNRHVLLVSSRASYEIVQKAVVAGIELLAAISAPSSLAVELAREAGTTLVGFLRGERLNVYTEEWRIG